MGNLALFLVRYYLPLITKLNFEIPLIKGFTLGFIGFYTMAL